MSPTVFTNSGYRAAQARAYGAPEAYPNCELDQIKLSLF